MNAPLRTDQIAEALRRHGLEESTLILGITYQTDPSGGRPEVTLNLPGRRLVVPADVMEMPAPASSESRRKTLFSRPE